MCPQPTDVRVLVVSPDPLARAGLAAVLGHQPGLIIAGLTGDGVDLSPEAEAERPDVVVWDLGPGGVPDFDRLSLAADAGVPIVALLAEGTHAAGCWSAGARGLLLRNRDGPMLLAALKAAAEGLVIIDPEFRGAFAPGGRGVPHALPEALTPREMEVLGQLAEGLPNKTIADRLGISEYTVKFHVDAILGKLGVQNRTEAIVTAIRLGLITV